MTIDACSCLTVFIVAAELAVPQDSEAIVLIDGAQERGFQCVETLCVLWRYSKRTVHYAGTAQHHPFSEALICLTVTAVVKQ